MTEKQYAEYLENRRKAKKEIEQAARNVLVEIGGKTAYKSVERLGKSISFLDETEKAHNLLLPKNKP